MKQNSSGARFLHLAAAGLLALPAVAHHSLGMFETQKTRKLEGTVSRFEWTNPHAWVWVSAVNERGEREEWGIEMAALSMLRRAGYSKDSFKVGEKLTVEFSPTKDGSFAGAFIRATFADGRMVGRRLGAGPPTAVPGDPGSAPVAGEGAPTESR